MLQTYRYTEYPHRISEDQKSGKTAHRPVVIVGGGPVGLTAAIDLRLKGVPVVLLNRAATVSIGSRAVCYSKRALEIWDRLGCAGRMIEKGVVWKTGRLFNGEREVFNFDLLPEPGHKIPAFINLQQYHLEDILIGRATELGVDIRWQEEVVGIQSAADRVALTVSTPSGNYAVAADWVIAADGSKSAIRDFLGLDFFGQVFKDRFLITDVVMKNDFPPERWFWFDPPFNPGRSTLLHKQSDDLWRIDFQLGWDADPKEEMKPERVKPRLKAMLGDNVDFEIEWVSVYTYQCRRLERFRHGRILFAGDSAHQVSPFGARGANSGVQDTDNLIWKLKLVIDRLAPDTLLDSYDEERVAAADINLMNSTRSTDFIVPKSAMSRVLRDSVLELAQDHAFARPLINSGRLSLPATYGSSALNTPDEASFNRGPIPGAPCPDAPVTAADGKPEWLLNRLGDAFTLLFLGPAENRTVKGCKSVVVGEDVFDTDGLIKERYDGDQTAVYLIRPDQHVVGRWKQFDQAAIEAALQKAKGRQGIAK